MMRRRCPSIQERRTRGRRGWGEGMSRVEQTLSERQGLAGEVVWVRLGALGRLLAAGSW